MLSSVRSSRNAGGGAGRSYRGGQDQWGVYAKSYLLELGHELGLGPTLGGGAGPSLGGLGLSLSHYLHDTHHVHHVHGSIA